MLHKKSLLGALFFDKHNFNNIHKDILFSHLNNDLLLGSSRTSTQNIWHFVSR